jgi:hypothetical protein
MDAAHTHSAPDRERAETYLRLRAEEELRTALAFARYKQPQIRLPARIRANVRMRRRRAHMNRMMRNPQRTGPASSPPLLRRAVSRVWQPVAPAWHRLVFGSWRLRRRLDWRQRRHYQPPPARACQHRMSALAEALACAGAVDGQVAASVLEDLRTALAARSLIDQQELLEARPRAWPQAPRSAPAPMRAIPVGVAATCQLDDRPARAFLGSLILDSGSAEMTVTVRFERPNPEVASPRRSRHLHPILSSLNECTAIDDRGTGYRAHFGGGGGHELWEGAFHFMPYPPTVARWLDVLLPGAEPIRVDLTARPVVLATTSTSLPAAETADRYLDTLSFDMLRRSPAHLMDQYAAASTVAIGLVEAGTLAAGSPALSRLVAVLRQTGVPVPASLADVPAVELPADWLALLVRQHAIDGPTGVTPVGTALPELDGASCLITDLISEPGQATMHIHARGWPMASHFGTVPVVAFRWTARDDLGGWYVADEGGSSSSNGQADLNLRLSPALNPRARSLQIILTGKTGEVSVTVPLAWREGP